MSVINLNLNLKTALLKICVNKKIISINRFFHLAVPKPLKHAKEIYKSALTDWDVYKKPEWNGTSWVIGTHEITPPTVKLFLFNMEDRRPVSLWEVNMENAFWGSTKPKLTQLDNGNFTLNTSITRNSIENHVLRTQNRGQ